jgi:hypothetical protein
MIQQTQAVVDPYRLHGVLDAPPEPVIGLAEGETRWRGMTVDGSIVIASQRVARMRAR